MTRKIYTYTDLKKIRSCDFYPEIRYLPQITVTTDLQKAIRWFPRTHGGQHLFNDDVRDFGQILTTICPDWKTPETLFLRTVAVSGILRRKISEAEPGRSQDYYRGFKRNSSAIAKAIGFLEEAQVQPETLRNAALDDKDIKEFCDLWDEVQDEDLSLLSLHMAFEELEDPAILERTLSRCFGHPIHSKIVLHGFYSISPLQERFFRLLEKNGHELIFLFPYDPRYPVALECWTKTYARSACFPVGPEWRSSGEHVTVPIGEMLEGRLDAEITNNIRIRRFRNTLEFAQAIKADRDDGIAVYSTASKEANLILKEFYPEEYGERRLLSYPVGRYLVALHSVWDDDTGTVSLQAEHLREIFASGWITVGDVSSREYIRDLEAVLPYFTDCKSVSQWQERLAHLQSTVATAVGPFREPNAERTADRWGDIMGDPLGHFSMFSVPTARLRTLLSLVEKTAYIAETLFSGERTTSISGHMKKLTSLVRNSRPVKVLLEEETAVVEELMHAISRLRHKELSCDIGDIVSAIRLYLNGELSEEDPDSDKLVGMVYPMSQIDAAAIKHGGRIHVCLADSDHMPGRQKPPYWPLSVDTLERCSAISGNTLLDLVIHDHKSAPVNSRYFMFSAFRNQEITLSWISEIGAKKLAPSPYILMLQESGHTVSLVGAENLSLKTVAEVPEATPVISAFTLPTGLPKDARMDHAICPQKYLYSYVLAERPSFFEPFQQGHALGGLIRAIMSVAKGTGLGKREAAKHVFALFPNMRQVEKQQILDYIGPIPADSALWDEYGGYLYPPARLEIAYPEETLRDTAIRKYAELSSQLGRRGMELFMPTDVKGACIYCPHADHCRNAVYALDQEEYYA